MPRTRPPVPLQKTRNLLRATAKLAAKAGHKDLTFTWQQLGDAYFIFGVNLTANKLLKHLLLRKNKACEKSSTSPTTSTASAS